MREMADRYWVYQFLHFHPSLLKASLTEDIDTWSFYPKYQRLRQSQQYIFFASVARLVYSSLGNLCTFRCLLPSNLHFLLFLFIRITWCPLLGSINEYQCKEVIVNILSLLLCLCLSYMIPCLNCPFGTGAVRFQWEIFMNIAEIHTA